MTIALIIAAGVAVMVRTTRLAETRRAAVARLRCAHVASGKRNNNDENLNLSGRYRDRDLLLRADVEHHTPHGFPASSLD
jgi:hypothetical protein